jgi:hypothetical protein
MWQSRKKLKSRCTHQYNLCNPISSFLFKSYICSRSVKHRRRIPFVSSGCFHPVIQPGKGLCFQGSLFHKSFHHCYYVPREFPHVPHLFPKCFHWFPVCSLVVPNMFHMVSNVWKDSWIKKPILLQGLTLDYALESRHNPLLFCLLLMF